MASSLAVMAAHPYLVGPTPRFSHVTQTQVLPSPGADSAATVASKLAVAMVASNPVAYQVDMAAVSAANRLASAANK